MSRRRGPWNTCLDYSKSQPYRSTLHLCFTDTCFWDVLRDSIMISNGQSLLLNQPSNDASADASYCLQFFFRPAAFLGLRQDPTFRAVIDPCASIQHRRSCLCSSPMAWLRALSFAVGSHAPHVVVPTPVVCFNNSDKYICLPKTLKNRSYRVLHVPLPTFDLRTTTADWHSEPLALYTGRPYACNQHCCYTFEASYDQVHQKNQGDQPALRYFLSSLHPVQQISCHVPDMLPSPSLLYVLCTSTLFCPPGRHLGWLLFDRETTWF